MPEDIGVALNGSAMALDGTDGRWGCIWGGYHLQPRRAGRFSDFPMPRRVGDRVMDR